MIQANSIGLSVKDRALFNNISFIINQHDKIGLVGRNGQGKTTLLRVIVDPSLLDDGSISIHKNKKIAYMPQEMVFQSTLSILDEALTAIPEIYALAQEAKKLEGLLEQSDDAALVERYGVLQEALQGYDYERLKAQAKKMLMGLGFSSKQFDQPASSLSVGWKMRIVLTKLLLQDADFYLFDEPTNHLDLSAKEWFLDFLKKADFGFIIISHEKYFLDELSEKILEIELGKATWYNGNYSEYVVKKEHDLELLTSAYVQQQKEIKQKQELISRFSAGTRSKMAQSMQRGLDKIDRIEIPPSPRNVRLTFPTIQQSGKEVIKVSDVSQKFGDKVIFQNVSFEVLRGHKVALVAANGVGKTTLFNLVAGILPLQHGTVTFGYNVTHALFAQDQNQVLQANLSIFDNIQHLCPRAPDNMIRSFLGAFLFSGQDAFKKVGVLSGGEKNRVGIVSVLLQQANLLLLDEPTNHLDIPSKAVLLRAMQEFQGTIMFVSHDRDFLNSLATDVIELTPQGAIHYHGNYDAYVYQKPPVQDEGVTPVDTRGAKAQSASSARQPAVNESGAKQLKQKEALISRLEQQMNDLSLLLADCEYGTPEFDSTLNKIQKAQKELQDAEAQWEKLQGKPL